jgi:hypothetical protein
VQILAKNRGGAGSRIAVEVKELLLRQPDMR